MRTRNALLFGTAVILLLAYSQRDTLEQRARLAVGGAAGKAAVSAMGEDPVAVRKNPRPRRRGSGETLRLDRPSRETRQPERFLKKIMFINRLRSRRAFAPLVDIG